MDLKVYINKMQTAVDHLNSELRKIRTGRAHPSMVDGLQAEVYGQMTPINQIANITAPEPQLLQITPFDPSNLQSIVTAIRSDQAMGLNPSDDGRVVRIPMPPLTEELRRQIVKGLGDTIEDTKISLRNIRHEALKEAKKLKESKELSEDDVKGVEKKITESINDFNEMIDNSAKLKEQEIMTV